MNQMFRDVAGVEVPFGQPKIMNAASVKGVHYVHSAVPERGAKLGADGQINWILECYRVPVHKTQQALRDTVFGADDVVYVSYRSDAVKAGYNYAFDAGDMRAVMSARPTVMPNTDQGRAPVMAGYAEQIEIERDFKAFKQPKKCAAWVHKIG